MNVKKGAPSTQKTGGLRAILSVPSVYEMVQSALGSNALKKKLVEQYIRPFPGASILDIGCGPGRMLDFLPNDISYVGYDLDPGYIEFANQRACEYAQFFCARVNDVTAEQFEGHFDIVLAKSLLHHLSDEEGSSLFDVASKLLKPGGVMVTWDAVYVPEQSRLAKWIISLDRGCYIRTREAYESLASKHFKSIESDIRHDMLRVPYTHIAMSMRDPHPS